MTRKRDQGVAHRDSSSKATVLPGWYNGDDDEAGWIGSNLTNCHSADAALLAFDDKFKVVQGRGAGPGDSICMIIYEITAHKRDEYERRLDECAADRHAPV